MDFIKNPFSDREGYHCFGCSPDNPIGLKLQFRELADEVTASWIPDEHFQGWNNILHGGIQATLLDEIGSWFVFAKMKKGCVTSRLDVKYRRPVPTNQGALTLKARLKEEHSRIVDVEIELYGPDGKLCSGGIASYFITDPIL